MRTKPRFALLLALGLALLAPIGTVGAKDAGLEVTGQAVMGNAVLVSVSNADGLARAGTVVVTVQLASGPAVAAKSVQVPARGSATVSVEFAGPVMQVIQVGIIETGEPIG